MTRLEGRKERALHKQHCVLVCVCVWGVPVPLIPLVKVEGTTRDGEIGGMKETEGE